MKQYGFRHRILMLAVALVFTTQLVMLFPVLDLIKRDSDAQADRTVGLAGALFDEYMRNRDEGHERTVGVVVSDYALREAVASGDDEATVRSVLRNHANRVQASAAAVLDLDGTVKVSFTTDDSAVPSFSSAAFASIENGSPHGVVDIGGIPYQTVTMPLRAPDIRAWVMLGFPIDFALATQLKDLTGVDVSFLSVNGVAPRVLSSTLPMEARPNALAGLNPTLTDVQRDAVDG